MTSTGKRGKIRRKVGTKDEAYRFARWCRAYLDQGQLPPLQKRGSTPAQMTIGHRIRQYMEPLPKGSPIRSYCRRWIELLGPHRLDSLTVGHLREWVTRAKAEYAPATVHRKFQVLQRVYSIAEEDDLIMPGQNPFRIKKKKLGLPTIDNKREIILQPEDELDLYAAFGWPWRLFPEWALLTGVRQANQLGLLKTDIIRPQQLILIPGSTTKQKKRHPVPLTDRALEILNELAEVFPDSPYAFPSPTGKRWTKGNFRKRIWRPAFDAVGLHEMCWHDLRHTLAYRLRNKGHGLEMVQEVLGHADLRMSQRYGYMAQDTVRQALENL